MITEAKLIVTINTRGLGDALDESEKRIKLFCQRSVRIIDSAARSMDKIGKRYMTTFDEFLSGPAIVQAAKDIIEFDARLARMCLSSGLARKQILGLKGSLFDAAKASRQNPGASIAPISNKGTEAGGFGEFESLVSMGGDSASVMKDFAFWSRKTAAKIQVLKTQLSGFANANLAGPIELINQSLDHLNNNPLTRVLEGVMKVRKNISSMKELLGMGGGKGGGPFSGFDTPVPVFVVNNGISTPRRRGRSPLPERRRRSPWPERRRRPPGPKRSKPRFRFNRGMLRNTAKFILRSGRFIVGQAMRLAIQHPFVAAALAGTALGVAFYKKTDVGKKWGDFLGGLVYSLPFVDVEGKRKTAEADASYNAWKAEELKRQGEGKAKAPVVKNYITINQKKYEDGRTTTYSDDANTFVEDMGVLF